ncbi:MAG TPA: peptidoglycan DD-metalloendopeptidase family protein [Leptospiraceae bacterium]|nr:peptidoglycan DD-metalloendopeptidase family protein [Leptospiraceae bacterium]
MTSFFTDIFSDSSFKKHISVSFTLLISVFFPVYSESAKYGWPVKSERVVTGSFGEFRMYNFHMGLDIGTEARAGVPILAMTDSVLNSVQSYRYSIGNAVILKHKDGKSSRYGHMSRFSDRIADQIRRTSMKDRLFFREDFEYRFKADETVEIKKGEIIGYSGDTGLGPYHLHAEIFENDEYLNPAEFLFPEGGNIFLNRLELHPADSVSMIDGTNSVKTHIIKKIGNRYTLESPVKLKGSAGIQIQGYEAMTNANRIGFQKISLKINDKLIQEISFSRIRSDETLKSCFVLNNYRSTMSGKPFQYILYSRSDSSPGLFLNRQKNGGLIRSEELTDRNNVEITFKGLGKNTAVFSFVILKDKADYPSAVPADPVYNAGPGRSLTLEDEDKKFSAVFSADSVFTDEYFYLEKDKVKENLPDDLLSFSQVHSLKPDYKEFNKGAEIRIRVDDSAMKWGKLGIYQITEKGKPFRFVSSAISGSVLSAKVRTTGSYMVLSDQSRPDVKILYYKNNQIFSSAFRLLFRAYDTGTGVPEKGIKATVDGEEIRFDYEPEKNYHEAFYPEKLFTKGSHTITYQAFDRAGNASAAKTFAYTVR